MQLLWLMRKGEPLKDAAEMVEAGYRTAQNWVDWYRSGGTEEARQGKVRTIWDGVEFAREQADVEYTYWGMRYVFERLDLQKKVTCLQSPEADGEEQTTRKKGPDRPLAGRRSG